MRSATFSAVGRQATRQINGTLAHGAIDMRSVVSVAFGLLTLAAAQANEPPQLSLPLICEPHKTCFIQSYVDLDTSPAVRDYACGSATYNGHSGVDFRVLSAAASGAGVGVIAAADGTVTGVRDGVADAFASQSKPSAIAGKECGNGVVIDHGGGWETQYCHLKQGSVTVAQGAKVKRGDRLGDVGYSGMADFAHLHLSVRHDNKIVDPFLPQSQGGSCERSSRSAGLWQPAVAAAFPYRQGEIIGVGIVGAPPDHATLEADHGKIEPLNTSSQAMVIYGRFVNLMKGDRLRFVIMGPVGTIVETVSDPLAKSKATFTSYAGKKRKADLWPPGRYEGRVELVREGGVIATSVASHDLR